MTIDRYTLLGSLKMALEPLTYVHAMWEAGAAAFDRIDEWSDIDLQVEVEDDHLEETFTVIDAALEALSPIDLKYRLPEPTWHGHSQAFYRLRDASPYMLLDLVVMKHSSPEKFLEPEVHGQAVFYMDRCGLSQPGSLLAGASASFDEVLKTRLQQRIEYLRLTFDLFQILTLKELNRGNSLEAFAFYQAYTLRPLVEALRIRYTPYHHNFHTRYIHYELPREVVKRLERLYFVPDPGQIAAQRSEAETWFQEIINSLSL